MSHSVLSKIGLRGVFTGGQLGFCQVLWESRRWGHVEKHRFLSVCAKTMKQHCGSQVHLTKNSLPVMTGKCVFARWDHRLPSHPFVRGRRCLKPKWQREPRCSVPVQQTGDNTDEHLLIPVRFKLTEEKFMKDLWRKWFKGLASAFTEWNALLLDSAANFWPVGLTKLIPDFEGDIQTDCFDESEAEKFHSSLGASEQMISQRGS